MVTSTANGGGGSGGGSSDCGGGLSAGANTSCGFAENVEGTFRSQGPGTYDVGSPATGGTYSMTCTESSGSVTCTGGNDASVYFPG